MKVQSIRPQFPDNYNVGYIGFTYVGGIVSTGIAWFERWHRMGDIKVTHTFIVSGPDECIEAHIDTGVARAPLSKYFNDPNTQVFFRKPKGWTPQLGQYIANCAADKIGCKYDTGLIVSQAAAESFMGRFINRIFRGWPNRAVSSLLNRPERFICSELVAYALEMQPEYQNKGILQKRLYDIDPQELFEDSVIFERWHNPSGHGPELNTFGAE